MAEGAPHGVAFPVRVSVYTALRFCGNTSPDLPKNTCNKVSLTSGSSYLAGRSSSTSMGLAEHFMYVSIRAWFKQQCLPGR